jgi:mxaK protein
MISAFPITQQIRSLMSALYGLGRRNVNAALLFLVIAMVLALIAAGSLWSISAARNRTIAALSEGHDEAISSDATPELLFARAYFLLTHDRLDDAQAVASSLERSGSDRLRADLHYDMANARLKIAFDKIERGDFDAAGALVGLAREDYREAIKLDPDAWNARFNFDVASRLVREYPSFGFTADERRQGPRPLWTELPNLPRGAP